MINLVRNAIRYSNFGNAVQIKYSQSTNVHKIKICNKGIGVELGIIDKMYDLYERGENAKNYTNKGSGIGLTVAKELAKKMNGDIYLEQANDPTIFMFTFPILNL